MNIYYTAKDIEELAAKGLRQLEIGPGVFLTDFARETAQQFGITLIDGRKQAPAAKPQAAPSSTAKVGDKYNKPAGCQHASGPLPPAPLRASGLANQPVDDADANTVNRLIDLMGKVIKRGG